MRRLTPRRQPAAPRSLPSVGGLAALLTVAAACVPQGSRRPPEPNLFDLFGSAAAYHDRLAIAQSQALLTQVLDLAADHERVARTIDGGAGGSPKKGQVANRAAEAAVAELAAHRLADLASEVPLLEPLGSHLERWRRDLPLGAVQVVLRMKAQLERQAGRDAAAAATQRERGCLLGWRAVGPLGQLTLADHDRPFAPELRQPGAAQLQEARANSARVLVDPGTCRVAVDSPRQRQGIYYLRTRVQLAQPTWVLLRVSGDDPFRVDVGQRTALDIDRRRAFLPVARTARLMLGAGTSEITVKIAAQGAEGAAHVFLTDEAGRSLSALTTAPPEPPLRAGALAPGSTVDSWRSPWKSPLGCDARRLVGPRGVRVRPTLACVGGRRGLRGFDTLLASLLQKDGETELVRPLLDRLIRENPADGALLQLRGETWLEDPSLGNRVARDRARRDLEEALKYEPWRARARFLLGAVEAQETGRAEKALAHLEAAADQSRRFEPHGHYSLWLQRYEIYREKGWEREARETLAEALKLNPKGCRAIELQADLARERGDVQSLDRYLADLARCDPASSRPAERARDRGDAARALAHYRLLLARPEASRHNTGTGYDDLVAEAAQMERALGQAEKAAARLAARLAIHPRSLWLRRALADTLVELGRSAEGVRVISEGLVLRPTADELRQAARALGHPGPLDAYRLDGKEIIRDYEQRAGGTGASAPGRGRGRVPVAVGEASGAAVYLLDRTVVRIYPDGDAVQAVHNIIKVLSKAGVDKHGEVEIPEHAEVLTLRTVKHNGETREPESIPAKETVSVPDLAPGDYVEFEHQEMQPARELLGRGYLSERFFFRTFEAPLDRSEFVVVAPAGVALDEDVRGDVEIRRERRGTLMVHTYRRRNNARLLPEPASSNMDDFAPSVRVSYRVSWESWAQQLRADSMATSRQNQELRELASRLTAEGRKLGHGRLGSALASYLWVTRNIEGKGDEGATATLSRRAGSRLALLRALLDAQGVPHEVLHARPRIGKAPQSRVPEPELYAAAFLRVRDEAGAVALELDPRWRYAPAGFLAPTFSGARALVVPGQSSGPGALPRWETLGAQPSRGKREVTLKAEVASDGSAKIEGREVLVGWPALEWRETLAQSDPSQVEKSFEERGLAGPFPGATLESLSFEGKTDPRVPLVLKYRFRVPRLGRRDGRDLVLPGAYFPSRIAPTYATLLARTLPLEIGIHPQLSIKTDLVLPAGTSLVGAPAPAEERARFGEVSGEYRTRVSSRKPTRGGLIVTTEAHLDLPPARVTPAGYAPFARWARSVDDLESREVRVRLP